MWMCSICHRVWRPRPKRYMTPCCAALIVPIGPGHPPQILREPGPMKDRVPGAGKAGIRNHLREVGAVGLGELRSAVRRGWLAAGTPDVPPMYPIEGADVSDIYSLALDIEALEGGARDE